MYKYKFVNINHSMWTGKPKERIEDVIEEFAAQGWRLVQICQDYGAMWYSGRIRSKIVFEKALEEAIYESRYEAEPEDSFV